VPGDEAARRARLVITNGGSSTGYQALTEGTPVLGIPYNLDQYLATDAIDRAGVGRSLRSGTLTAEALGRCAMEMLGDDVLRGRTEALGRRLRQHDASSAFRAFVDRVVASATGACHEAAGC
jgi:UDP:flavonoid glycosyltransferase YjiC (YdhE family)